MIKKEYQSPDLIVHKIELNDVLLVSPLIPSDPEIPKSTGDEGREDELFG